MTMSNNPPIIWGANSAAKLLQRGLAATEGANLSTPPSGTRYAFAKSDGWYEIDSAGNVRKFSGDVTGQASSVDSEIALFSGTGGKTIKRYSGTGYLYANNGVITQGTTVPASDVLGRTDGSNPASGRIGQLVEVTKTTTTSGMSTTAGTYSDVGLGTFQLSAGSWEVEASVTLACAGAAGTGTNGRIFVAAIQNSDTVTILRESAGGFANASTPSHVAQLSVKLRVNPTGTTTYKLLVTTVENNTATTNPASFVAYASSTQPIVLRAVRVG